LSPLQRPEVSGQFPNLWLAQLFAERWHLAFDSGGDHLTNASIALVEIMLIGPSPRASSHGNGRNSSETNADPGLHRLSAPAIVLELEG
jgi:hypothetical protein